MGGDRIRSSIKPAEKPNTKPFLVYSGQKTLKSYEENGFNWRENYPLGPMGCDEPERFLSEVDPKKKTYRSRDKNDGQAEGQTNGSKDR